MDSVSILSFGSYSLLNTGVRSALDGNNSTYEMRKGHPFGRATVHSYEKKEEEKKDPKDEKKEKEAKKKDKKSKKDKKKVEEPQDKLILTNSMCDGEDFVDGSHILITHKVNDSYYKSKQIVTALKDAKDTIEANREYELKQYGGWIALSLYKTVNLAQDLKSTLIKMAEIVSENT